MKNFSLNQSNSAFCIVNHQPTPCIVHCQPSTPTVHCALSTVNRLSALSTVNPHRALCIVNRQPNKCKSLKSILVMALLLCAHSVWGGGWTRVTTVDELKAGGTFIMGYEATANSGVIVPMQNSGTATTSAAGLMYSGTDNGSSGSGTINMSTVTETAKYEVTIAASTSVDGAITIKVGGNFIGNENTKNNCKLYTTESEHTAFTPTFGTNNVCTLTIAANTGNTTNYTTLQYNSSSGSERYAVYGGAQKNVVFYKKGSECTSTLTTPFVTATGHNQSATLSWPNVQNATKYQVSWNGGAYADASSPYEKSGLTNGTEYSWKVKAIGNGSTICDSEEATGTVTPNVTWTDYLTECSSEPTLSVSVSSLSGFSYIVGYGPSAAQSFKVSGSNLKANVSVSAPTNYEISTSEGGDYTTNPIILNQSNGTLAETTIYVRLKSGLAVAQDPYIGNISITSTEAETKPVSLSGSVIAKVLNSISVKTQPTTTTYTLGQAFNPAGLVITAHYNSGDEDVTYNDHSGDFTFTDGATTALTAEMSTIKVYYGGQSADISLTLNCSIQWLVNGEEYTTGSPATSVALGGTVLAPATAPSIECGGKEFVGWKAGVDYEHATDAPAGMFTATSAVISANTTFRAVFANHNQSGSGDFVLVTTAPQDWSGKYLIVEQTLAKCFDGSLTTLDAVGNFQSVTYENEETKTVISHTDALEGYMVTVSQSTTVGKYNIQTASGYYIGSTGGATTNELLSSTTEKYNNTISYADGGITIQGTNSKFNFYYDNSSAYRFRYYGTSATKVRLPKLYRFDSSISTTNYSTKCAKLYEITSITVDPAGYGSVDKSSVEGIPANSAVTVNANTFTVNEVTVTATPATPDPDDGYTYSFSSWSNLPATITADVDNVTANFTRTAKTYDVTYNLNGGAWDGEAGAATYTFGVGIPTLATNVVKMGYTFGGWFGNSELSGDAITSISATAIGAQTLYAKWNPATDTPYKVYHYQQNIANDEYTLFATENLTGTTDAEVTPDVKDYTGFTAPSTQTVTIAAAGTTTVTYYYTRNTYALAWALDGGTITVAGTPKGQVKYGATLTAPTVEKTGYSFVSWSPTVSTMPANNKTYTATWTPLTTTPYTVRHYQQNIAGDEYVLAATDNLVGTTDAQVTPDRKAFTGFTAPAGQEVTIAAAGNTVVDYYYTRNSYLLTWDPDGGILTGDYTSGQVKFEAPIIAPANPTKSGNTFEGWSDGEEVVTPVTTMPASALTYTATWAAASYFTQGETMFFRSAGEGAWGASACVTSEFSNDWQNKNNINMTWMYNVGSTDYKMFYVVVPNNDYDRVELWRYQPNSCLDDGKKWNSNGHVLVNERNGKNVILSSGTGTGQLSWYTTNYEMYLQGGVDSWASNLATFADQLNGNFSATVNNVRPTATSYEFRVKDNNGQWFGSGNTTLSNLRIGSVYNISASFNIDTRGTLTLDKTLVSVSAIFDMQGHGEQVETQADLAVGSSVIEPAAPTATGYTFGGWYKEAACENAWNFATDVLNESETLYAKWTSNHPGTVTISGTYHYWEGETISLTASVQYPERLKPDVTYTWKRNGVVLDGQTSATLTIANCIYDNAGVYTCTVANGGTESTSDNFGVKILAFVLKHADGSTISTTVLTKPDEGTVVTLPAFDLKNENSTYKFCIVDGAGGRYGNDGQMTNVNCTNWAMDKDNDCRILTSGAGNYTFSVDYANLGQPKVSVTYPDHNQAAGNPIYFDNSQGWSADKLYYRIGASTTLCSEPMTRVPGTSRLYTTTTKKYDSFLAWHIGNNAGWTNNEQSTTAYSIYKTKTGDEYAITNSTAFIKSIVGETGITVIPTSEHNTGIAEDNNNCEFYVYNSSAGLLTHTATVTTPSHGIITLSWTDITGTAQSATATTANLAHTCNLTITATPATGYELTSLTVNGEAFTSGEVHVLDADATIAATFGPSTYSVTLNKNGGTCTDLTSYTYGEGATLPTDATKSGADFGGWYASSTFDGDAVTAIGATETGNKEFWAMWTYLFSYNCNGGTFTGEYSTTCDTYLTVPENTQMTVTSGEPAKTGYSFDGWQLNGAGDYLHGGDKVTVTQTTELVAHFTAQDVAYQVIHRQQDVSGSGYTIVETVDGIAPAGSSITPEVKEYTGFNSPVAQTVTVAGDGSTKVTYDYSRKTYAITWTLDDGFDTQWYQQTGARYESQPTYKSSDPATSDCDYTRVFVGWLDHKIALASAEASAPTGMFQKESAPTVSAAATYYAVFANYENEVYSNYATACVKKYTVTEFSDANGNSIKANNTTVAAGETVTLTVTTADGWKNTAMSVVKTSSQSTIVEVTDNQFTMPAYDVTVKATFVPVHRVFFHVPSGGCITAPATIELQTSEVVPTLPAPTGTIPGGWTFAGWSKSEVTTETTTMPEMMYSGGYLESDIDVYALYQKAGTETLTFDQFLSGSTYNSAYFVISSVYSSAEHALPNTTVINSSDRIASTTITSVSDGMVTNASEIAATKMLFRKISSTEVQILNVNNMFLDGKEGKLKLSTTAATWTKGGSGTQANPVRFTINGKALRINSSHEYGHYAAAATQVNDTKILAIANNTVYYLTDADCVEKWYVNYDANGGETTCSSGKKVAEGFTICADAPTRDHYTFDGWSDGVSTYAAGAEYTLTKDVTFTAQWTLVQYTVTFKNNGETVSTRQVGYGNAVGALPHLAEDDAVGCNGPSVTFMGWIVGEIDPRTAGEPSSALDYITPATIIQENKTFNAVWAEGVEEEVKP